MEILRAGPTTTVIFFCNLDIEVEGNTTSITSL
jgi:hypothetical protein